MPGELFLPVLQPAVDLHVDIVLGSGYPKVWDVDSAVGAVEGGLQGDRSLEILERSAETS